MTRSLLLMGASAGTSIAPVWSARAEQEADRHLGDRAMRIGRLRDLLGWELAPSGRHPERFPDTVGEDEQILADAVAARARFIITSDVDDFAVSDLASVGISAVDPDFFMSERFDDVQYLAALNQLSRGRTRWPSTPDELHAALAKNHPRLFASHSALFDVEPVISPHAEPKEVFRGRSCVRCSRPLTDERSIRIGPWSRVSPVALSAWHTRDCPVETYADGAENRTTKTP